LIIIISVSVLFPKQNQHYKWETIELNTQGEIFFVAGTSNDFWVRTNNGDLFRITNDRVSEHYKVPNYSVILSNFYQINENEFLVQVVTVDWKGAVFKLKNGNWLRYNVPYNLPMHGIFKLNGKYYVCGDFGVVLELRANNYKVLQTPFESHCILAIQYKNQILFSTRADGVFLFDGEKFKKVAVPKEYSFSKDVRRLGNEIYFYTIDNKLYHYENKALVKSNNAEIRKVFQKVQPEKFAFGIKYFYHKNRVEHIKFPQFFNVNDVHPFSDGTILLLREKDFIYKGIPSKQGSFINLAQYYKISGLPNSKTKFSAFWDANSDGIADLFVINNNFGEYISFYRGVLNSSFADISSLTGLPFNLFPVEHATITDIDKDGFDDIILQMVFRGQRKIRTYVNEGNFSFKFKQEFNLPEEIKTLGLRYLSAYDYDNDGDDDIVLTSYYGEKNESGYVLVYRNDLWGSFSVIDTLFKRITHRWNEKILFGDLNNDNFTDYYEATAWSNDKLFIARNGKFTNETTQRLPLQKNTETIDILFFDYNNDGDLDIILYGRSGFLRIYDNNGNGYFKDVSANLFKEKSFKAKVIKIDDFALADLDNDGYVDIIASLTFSDFSNTYLFFNKKGEFFVSSPISYDKKNYRLTSITTADIDSDGDLDIFGSTGKSNALFINTFDENNFVEVKLNGVTSETSGKGSKIWIYEAGKLNDKNYLLGYKQVGTETVKKNSLVNLPIHFGIGAVYACDIKVRFPSGRTVTVKNVHNGERIIINELPAFPAFFYNLPRNVYGYLSQPKNQLYIIVALLAHLIIIFGFRFGLSKLHWSLKLAFAFVLLNLFTFWVTLYTASFSAIAYTRYVAPLFIVSFMTLLPLGLSYFFGRTSKKDIEGYNARVLELVMAFSHGEWALRNLNSIILLCENSPKNWRSNQDFIEKLNVRLKTFSEMTTVVIKEILELETLLENNKQLVLAIEEALNAVESEVKHLHSLSSLTTLIENFLEIRELLKTLRDDVFARFSCDPAEVINSVATNYEQVLAEKEITLRKVKKYPQNIPVLIKNYELGDIIDNLFQNSIKFMSNRNEKLISIEIYKESPKIIIKFANNGKVIPQVNWEKIFEQGYSRSGSTGQGLYHSREILKKYGGRIYVHKSDEDLTVFIIELNEGKEKG
jgi:signal transduction histidine kinase